MSAQFQSKENKGQETDSPFWGLIYCGDGVRNEQRFGDLIEQALPNTEVYNFGLPGTGTDQQYQIYNSYAKNISCDQVVIIAQVENIRRVAARYRHFKDRNGKTLCYAKPYYTLQNNELKLNHVPVPRLPVSTEELSAEESRFIDTGGRFPLLRKIFITLGLKNFLQRITRYQPVPHYDKEDNSDWLVMSEILRQWIRQCHAPVLLVPMPLYTFVEEKADPSSYQKRFQELASELGCQLFDPLEGLKKYPMQKRVAFRFKRDMHPSPEGHKAFARIIQEALQEQTVIKRRAA